MSGPLISREVRGLFYANKRLESLLMREHNTTHKKERKNGEKIIYIRVCN